MRFELCIFNQPTEWGELLSTVASELSAFGSGCAHSGYWLYTSATAPCWPPWSDLDQHHLTTTTPLLSGQRVVPSHWFQLPYTALICRSPKFLSYTWAFLRPWRFYAFWADLPAIGNCWIGFYALTLNRAPRLGPKWASADKTAGLRAQGLSPLEIALVHRLYIIATIILHHPYNLSLFFAAVIKR